MKLSRVNKTITVDPVKMSLFENTKNVHGLNISDFVDKALEDFLSQSAPDEMQKLHIQTLKTQLLEAEQSLPEIEFMMKMKRQQQNDAKNEQDKLDNELDSRLEDLRNTKYNESKKSLVYQIKRKTIDWKVIMNVFGFKNQIEAKVFVTEKLKDEGLL